MNHKTKSNMIFCVFSLLMLVIVTSCSTSIGDTDDPAVIEDLDFDPVTRQLRWTSPGDDGNDGRATIYDVRFSESEEEIADDFSNAIQVLFEPRPEPAGTPQDFIVPRLDITGTEDFFFAMSARDEVGNMADPSNVVQAQTPLVSIEFQGDTVGGCFGESVGVGDFNRDSSGDIIVGDPCLSMVYIFFGPRGLLTDDPDDDDEEVFNNEVDVTIIGNPGDMLGASVAGVESIGGDFTTDFVIGAPGFDGERGAVFIIFGDTELPETIDLTSVDQRDILITGEDAGDNFGASVTSSAGIEGSARRTLIVGAPGANSETGKAYLFRTDNIDDDEDSIVPASEALAIFQGEAAGDMFGFAVSETGDLDEDAFSEFAVGAPGAGKVHVFFGEMNISAATADVVTIEGDSASQFGFSVSGGEDIDIDMGVDDEDETEVPDLIVGAPDSDSGAGSVFLYSGEDIASARGTAISPVVETEFTGENPGDAFGTSVSVLGDIDPEIDVDEQDNGFILLFDPTNADLAVGAPGMSGGTGAVYLFFGRDDFPASVGADEADVMLEGNSPGEEFGRFVSGVLDVTIDLVNDFVVSGSDFVRLLF